MSANTKANSTSKLTRAQRLIQVLDQFGIEQAHFVADVTDDWDELVSKHAHRIASLTLIFPNSWDISKLQVLATRLLIIHGDQPPEGEPIAQALSRLPGARHITLEGFSNMSWDDPIPKFSDLIVPRLLDFLEAQRPGASIAMSESPATATGEMASVSWQVQGSGQAVVLLPLGLAPSQWDNLLPALRERYCTLLLGGTELGFVPLLEQRGRSAGYQRLLRNMLYELRPRAGETIVDVGCGTGVVDRWLVGYTGRQNPIVGVDLNAYLLREAGAQVRKEGLESTIQLREGNAVALPFDDNSYDVVFSTTVMEEVDAGAMLSELIRVTKPGGRIGVVVRAMDVPRPTSVQVRPEVKLKCEAPPSGGVSKLGCASADLYQRFHRSSLTKIRALPDWTVFSDLHGFVEEFLISSMMANLAPTEAAEWHAAAERAAEDGSFFLTWPHHCAVGTRPG